MTFGSLIIIFLILMLVTTYFWQRSLASFKEELRVSEPKLWEQFEKPNDAYHHASPDQQIREYIWKREYLNLDNLDLIRKGNAVRMYHLIYGLATAYLIMSCFKLFVPTF
jgi:hypothetical protein